MNEPLPLRGLALVDYDAEVAASELPVVIDFWAPWCSPCMTLMPIMEAVAAEYGNKMKFMKVNTSEETSAMERFGVRGIPTMIVFKNGEEVARHVGVLSKLRLRTFLASYAGDQ